MNNFFWYWWDDDDDYSLGAAIALYLIFISIVVLLSAAYGIYGLYGLIVWILRKTGRMPVWNVDWVFGLQKIHSDGMNFGNVVKFDLALIAELPFTGTRSLYRYIKNKNELNKTTEVMKGEQS